jgi:hypothetical protein
MEEAGIEIVPGKQIELVFVRSNSDLIGDKLCLRENANNNIDYLFYITSQLASTVSQELTLYDKELLQDLKNYGKDRLVKLSIRGDIIYSGDVRIK